MANVTELNAMLVAGREDLSGRVYPDNLERLECRDGFSVSMQASTFHYCSPRDNAGPYTHVELGYPYPADEMLMPYAEDKNDPTGTVYGHVPLEVVARLVAAHGGLK